MALVHGDPSSSMPEAERQRLESLIAASCARDGVDIHHGNPEYWRARYAASAECGGVTSWLRLPSASPPGCPAATNAPPPLSTKRGRPLPVQALPGADGMAKLTCCGAMHAGPGRGC